MIFTTIVRLILFIFIGFLVVAAATSINVQAAEAPTRPIEVCSSNECIEKHVKENFPELYDIVKCESGFRQFNKDGSVLKSHTKDYGAFQINEYWWGETAKKLGHDIHTYQGNYEMAKVVYKAQGRAGWVCSQLI